MEACSCPWGGAGKPDPPAGRAWSGRIRTPRAHAPGVVVIRNALPRPRANQGRGWGEPRRRSPGASAGRGSDGHLAPTRQGLGAGRGNGPLDRGARAHTSSSRTRNRSKPACSQTSSKIRPRSRRERCSRRAFVLIVRYGVPSLYGPQALAAQFLIWSRVILASSRLVTRRRLGAGDLRRNGSSSGSSGMGVSSRLEGILLPPSSPRRGASARDSVRGPETKSP
jgi:hypothetical protein